MKRSSSVSILLILIVLTSRDGYALFGTWFPVKWKEEVRLSDGRTIVVERQIRREPGGGEWASNRSGTKPKEYRIGIPDPKRPGSFIEWRSTKKSPRTYPEIPLVLDVVSGEPVVYSICYYKEHCERYAKYVWRDGTWFEELLPETFDPMETNLILKLGTEMPPYVDLETKKKDNAKPGYRKSIHQVGPKREVCPSR